MAKIAFFNLPARGHLNPTIPVVKELASRGAEVHYFIEDEYRNSVELAGSTFHSLPSLKRLGEASTQRRSAPDDRQIALMPFAMGYQAPQVVPQLVEELRALGPECLVYNTLSLWPRLAAHILDIATVGFRPFHAPRERRSVAAPFASDKLAKLSVETDRRLSALMVSFGKPPIVLSDLISHVDDLTLMFLVRELQYDAEAFDERFLFVGPSFIQGTPEPWPFQDSPDRHLRRAYVSLGTMRNDDPEFYRACFSAFNPDNWEVVMSVGNHVDLEMLAPVPHNFLVARSVRQTAVLPHADVFVTHGGLNSVMESLAFGVPMVIVPSIKEQQLTADRVQALGCGVAINRESITADSLLRHASAMVADDRARTRLGEMREKIASSGGYRQAAKVIVEYAQKIRGEHT